MGGDEIENMPVILAIVTDLRRNDGRTLYNNIAYSALQSKTVPMYTRWKTSPISRSRNIGGWSMVILAHFEPQCGATELASHWDSPSRRDTHS